MESEISELEREFADLEEVWKSEKAAVQGTTHIKESLEQARLEFETARRAGDLQRMSELQYGRIPELERQLDMAGQAEMKETHLLRNKVTEEQIAGVVSKWTGIPVSKMLEGEKEKLLRMESRAGETRGRADRGGHRGVQCDTPLACRPRRSEPAERLIPVPRSDRGG